MPEQLPSWTEFPCPSCGESCTTRSEPAKPFVCEGCEMYQRGVQDGEKAVRKELDTQFKALDVVNGLIESRDEEAKKTLELLDRIEQLEWNQDVLDRAASEFYRTPLDEPDVAELVNNIRKLKGLVRKAYTDAALQFASGMSNDEFNKTLSESLRKWRMRNLVMGLLKSAEEPGNLLGNRDRQVRTLGPQQSSPPTSSAAKDLADGYTAARAFAAEGARVGLISCLRCGACLVLDPSDTEDVRAIHDSWHHMNE